MSLLFGKNLTGMVRERKDTDQKNTSCLNNRTLTLTNEREGQFRKRGSLTPSESYPGSGNSSLGFKVLTSPLAIRGSFQDLTEGQGRQAEPHQTGGDGVQQGYLLSANSDKAQT